MPLSSLPSTPHPGNPGSPSDNDLGDDGNEDPFNDDNNNNNNDNEYENTNDVCKPNTFDGTDPKKLCTFLVQCKLNFQDHPSTFKKDHPKVIFMQSYLKGMTLKWFKPDLLSFRNPGSCPLWMDD
ncbi:hypothetical protein ID866_10175 [Astraeus odoratus]|nr:hypothetical protein ID866_10175 [Astraeus odoratus]